MIIAIIGKIGSGKSTLAGIIKKHYGEKAEVVPFAKSLKDAAKELGWDGVKDKRGRKLLQMLGTEIGRNLIDKDIWCKRWYRYCLSNQKDVLVVDDVRYVNELDWVYKLADASNQRVVTIRLNKRIPKWKLFLAMFISKYKYLLHSSETSLDNVKTTITFDTTEYDCCFEKTLELELKSHGII